MNKLLIYEYEMRMKTVYLIPDERLCGFQWIGKIQFPTISAIAPTNGRNIRRIYVYDFSEWKALTFSLSPRTLPVPHSAPVLWPYNCATTFFHTKKNICKHNTKVTRSLTWRFCGDLFIQSEFIILFFHFQVVSFFPQFIYLFVFSTVARRSRPKRHAAVVVVWIELACCVRFDFCCLFSSEFNSLLK